MANETKADRLWKGDTIRKLVDQNFQGQFEINNREQREHDEQRARERGREDAEQKRDRADMDNAALRACCVDAAAQIFHMIIRKAERDTCPDTTEIAAVIYAAMRNGREL